MAAGLDEDEGELEGETDTEDESREETEERNVVETVGGGARVKSEESGGAEERGVEGIMSTGGGGTRVDVRRAGDRRDEEEGPRLAAAVTQWRESRWWLMPAEV